VIETRARFLFADCRDLTNLDGELAPLLEESHKFGCTTVYVLRERPGMIEAAGRPDE
jgi:hypothetical protein